MTDEGLELYPGALAGYRAFKLFCGRLYSLTKNYGGTHYEYSLEENEASCYLSTGSWRWVPAHIRVPEGDCKCGFWMYKDLAGALAEPLAYPYHDNTLYSQLMGVPTVLMVVAGWGKVVEDEIGFRTEYMRPLAMVETSSKVPEDERYGSHTYAFRSYDIGLPTTDPDGLPTLVEDYGLTVLEREEAELEPGSLSALVSASNVFILPLAPPPAPLPVGGAWPSSWGMAPVGSTPSRQIQTVFDKMLKGMARVVDSCELLRYKNGTRCCGNNQKHERSGEWCRRVFSTFFVAVENEGGLSLEEYRESIERGLNRRPVLPGYMRQKVRA